MKGWVWRRRASRKTVQVRVHQVTDYVSTQYRVHIGPRIGSHITVDRSSVKKINVLAMILLVYVYC